MKNVKQLLRLIKPTLIHVEYQEYTDQDRNHNASYKDAVSIEHCRVDIQRTYTQNSNTESESISAVLFMFNGLTKPFVPLKEN